MAPDKFGAEVEPCSYLGVAESTRLFGVEESTRLYGTCIGVAESTRLSVWDLHWVGGEHPPV